MEMGVAGKGLVVVVPSIQSNYRSCTQTRRKAHRKLHVVVVVVGTALEFEPHVVVVGAAVEVEPYSYPVETCALPNIPIPYYQMLPHRLVERYLFPVVDWGKTNARVLVLLLSHSNSPIVGDGHHGGGRMAVANVSNSPIVGDRHDGGAMLAVAEVALHLDLLDMADIMDKTVAEVALHLALLDMVDKVQHPNSLYCHWNILVLAPRLTLFRYNFEEMIVDLNLHA